MPRCVGENREEVVDFSVYCPKTLGGINADRWPDTITDRGIRVLMQRKRPDQKVERLRIRKLLEATGDLRARLARWAQEHTAALLDAEPELPRELNDRAAEAWEPLLAIAELADRECDSGLAARARKAAVKLSGGDVESGEHGVLALGAIRDLLGDADAIHTKTIVEALNENESLPFGDYRKGRGLTAMGLAKMLRPFAITARNVRVDGEQAKGFSREAILNAADRYCPRLEPVEDDFEGEDDLSSRPPVPSPLNTGDCGGTASPSEGVPETQAVPPKSPVNTGDGTAGRVEVRNPGANTNGALSDAERAAAWEALDAATSTLLDLFPGTTVEDPEGE